MILDNEKTQEVIAKAIADWFGEYQDGSVGAGLTTFELAWIDIDEVDCMDIAERVVAALEKL